jgi:hypothetical protein
MTDQPAPPRPAVPAPTSADLERDTVREYLHMQRLIDAAGLAQPSIEGELTAMAFIRLAAHYRAALDAERAERQRIEFAHSGCPEVVAAWRDAWDKTNEDRDAAQTALTAERRRAEAERDQFKTWLTGTQEQSEGEVLDLWKRFRAAEAERDALRPTPADVEAERGRVAEHNRVREERDALKEKLARAMLLQEAEAGGNDYLVSDNEALRAGLAEVIRCSTHDYNCYSSTDDDGCTCFRRHARQLLDRPT